MLKLYKNPQIGVFTSGYVRDYFLAGSSNFLESPQVAWQLLTKK